MLEYHAAYYPIEDGWYMAKVLDFPGAVSQGRTLPSARRMIRDSLEGLAEFILEKGERLPKPNPRAKDGKAVYQEKIVLDVQRRTGRSDETKRTPSTSSAARVRLRARGG
jgi:predicted RNase H-like HicB family nuclease